MRVLLIASPWHHGLSVAIHVVRHFHVIGQRQIQHIQPNDRLGAIVAVFVPQACGRQNQITSAHRALFTIDSGVSTLALHNHAHRIGCVSVAGRPFTGHE